MDGLCVTRPLGILEIISIGDRSIVSIDGCLTGSLIQGRTHAVRMNAKYLSLGHINNLYNTTFHALVQQGGMTNTDAEEYLKGTVAADKNEILFSKFGINYNNEPEMYRKGSVVYRAYALEEIKEVSSMERSMAHNTGTEDSQDDIVDHDVSQSMSKTQQEKIRKARQKAKIVVEHIDIIKDEFWVRRPWILSGKPGKPILDDQ